MALSAISPLPLAVSLGFHRLHCPTTVGRRFSYPCASLSSSSSESKSAKASSPSDGVSSSNGTSTPLVEPSRAADSNFSYAYANPSGGVVVVVVRFIRLLGLWDPLNPQLRGLIFQFFNGFMTVPVSPDVKQVIFDFRFLALLAVGGSLAGSLLCFLNGCVYICDAYKVYWSSCVKGIHTGQMVLRLVEAIDVYLAGTVMLIFGMGLYGLFISNVSPDELPPVDRALKGSSLFGMFALKERPKWMKISSLDELKTKVGHVIVMILLVKMFERSKMVTIATGLDLLSYSVCIFLSSASLYILHNLHRPE
ncbi:hypothetical protein SDJN02_00213 [Cucurbita argyrosperma subsp. argyrosperma]|nr:hypothetical protein SDJN02_00213 [Cucurbita argyrosperma subsp. argyrosperma]